MTSAVTVRPLQSADLRAVASLRYQFTQEADGHELDMSFDDFLPHFLEWERRNRATHHCMVLLRGDTVIGMAWLAVTARVPSPHAPHRRAGDVQSVYVLAHERNSGLGGRLLDAVLELARTMDLERVTVHSSERAVTAYRRHGFAVSPHLLQVDFGSH